ncbi:hypothetical protein JCM19233_1799 [Vibrio astriarenae]|nr:hypothetical protein JCM19233_1799 [Vibrio sp. C7]
MNKNLAYTPRKLAAPELASGTAIHIDHDTLVRVRQWYGRNYREDQGAKPIPLKNMLRLALQTVVALDEVNRGLVGGGDHLGLRDPLVVGKIPELAAVFSEESDNAEVGDE